MKWVRVVYYSTQLQVPQCLRSARTAPRLSISFEVPVPPGLAVSGVVLADQVRSLDWQARNADYLVALPEPVVSEVIDKIRVLID